MNKFEAVIFDIDGTLTPEISWTSLTRDLGASVDDHIRIYQDFKNGLTDYEQSKHELLTLWQGTGNATHGFFSALFENWILPDASLVVVQEIQKTFPICLITGSMELYAQSVAKKLSVRDYFANTTLHWDTAGNLVDMDYDLDQASKKLEQFIGYCLQHNFQPNEVAVVGDGENDIEIFKLSNNGIAVGTNIPRELEAVAWRCINSIDELPATLALR